MANNLQYVIGDFEGHFFTNQKSALGHGETTPGGGLHNVNLYKGELINVKPIQIYKPEDYLDRDALFLHNVTNIQLHPGASSPLTEKKIYDFDQIVLKNVEVVNSWELNDKTYGVLKGQLVGKIKQLSSITPPPDPLQKTPVIPPPPVGGGTTKPPPIGGGDRGWQRILPPIITGGGGSNRGCLSWFWDILKWLLLLLLILFLLKQCRSCKNGSIIPVNIDSSCYKSNDSLIRVIKHLNETILLNDSVCKKQLEKERIQNELDNLSSQIFFNGGSTDIRRYSVDEIDHIVEILNKYPSLKLEVQGFYNGTGNVDNPTLDIDRANKVKDLILDKGVNADRINTIGLGNTKPVVREDEYETDPFGHKYNRNMRVEIKIVRY